MKQHNNMTEAELLVLYYSKIDEYNSLVDEIRQILREMTDRQKEEMECLVEPERYEPDEHEIVIG